ncbi:hypothetical protein MHU86_15197 [Fragilaria crotonensis]|nr:hypothetical protein MHU86_15197 [Fragilaria crotonensis]
MRLSFPSSSRAVVANQVERCSFPAVSVMQGSTRMPLQLQQQQQQQQRSSSSWHRQNSTFAVATPLSRREAQELLDTNTRFRQAVLDFTTYRDVAEGKLGGPSVDLVDKAIQLDYRIRLRSSMRQQELKLQRAQQQSNASGEYEL